MLNLCPARGYGIGAVLALQTGNMPRGMPMSKHRK